MLTELRDLEQGTEEWLDARRGIVTASVVGSLITVGTPDALTVGCPRCHALADNPCLSLARKTPTPVKTVHDERAAIAAGRPPTYTVARNDTSRGLTVLLVAERITGWTEETPITADMWRGTYSEPIARDLYSKHHAPVTESGFMRRDEDGWTLGYSPDGLVGEEGLIEIKAPRAKSHLRTILADAVPDHYLAQLQAGLLVSGRAFIDYVSYCGGMPLFVKRVTPEPLWFDAITDAAAQFEANAAEMVAAYTQATEHMPATERVSLEIVI